MKHKNTSKWARRALKRGVNVMDEGMRGAIAEQLRLGQELRQKVRGCLHIFQICFGAVLEMYAKCHVELGDAHDVQPFASLHHVA